LAFILRGFVRNLLFQPEPPQWAIYSGTAANLSLLSAAAIQTLGSDRFSSYSGGRCVTEKKGLQNFPL